MKTRLRRLADVVANITGAAVRARSCVDSAPLLEREAARRAGVGFVAKSTMTIVPGAGSYLLLGELILDVKLQFGSPNEPGCGRCRACLDACPTNAFVGPYELDARRCISYLTIELNGVIPRALRGPIGNRIFGCDVCQQVCPYNGTRHEPPLLPEMMPRETLSDLSLIELLEIGAAAHRRLVKGSALARASRRMLQRNAAVALGNSGHPAAVSPLMRAATENSSALVRGHAAWALGELQHLDPRIPSVLQTLRDTDSDDWVREEATLALDATAR
jgi:epoxyqueuosine reductase